MAIPACSSDSGDSANADTRANNSSADAGAAVADADVGDRPDPCNPSEQFWVVDEVALNDFSEDSSVGRHESSAPIDTAGPETAGAIVRDGVLLINTAVPDFPPVGFTSLQMGVRTTVDGPIPSIHQFEEPMSSGGFDFADDYDGTYAGYGVITESPPSGIYSSTQLNQSSAGEVVLETCPNEVGQLAIGRFVDAEFGLPFTRYVQVNGEFTFVVYESDGSLDCNAPTLCDY